MSAEAEQPEPRSGSGGKGATRDVALGRHIRIHPDQRLPHFDRPGAFACAASDSEGTGVPVYALICEAEAPPRLDVMVALSRMRGVPMAIPVEWNVVHWPAAREERIAVVLQRPMGEAVAQRPTAVFKPWREEHVISRVIAPMAGILRDLEGRGVTHRAIAAHNLFVRDGASGEVMLGECVGTAPGLVQPTTYETIQGGQADPAGRGEGTTADDLYALGVLLAVLLCGGDRMAEWSDRAILDEKIGKGSYAAVVGRTSLSLKLMEPLRGLLCDVPSQRWGVDDLELWLGGRQLSPKQSTLPPKARRAFPFGGAHYWSARGLSQALAMNWQEALRVSRGGDIGRWAERSIVDEKHAALVHTASSAAEGGHSGSEDLGLARLLIALDPLAPVRLRGLSVRLDALPQALALGYRDQTRRNLIVEAIVGRLPQAWMEVQSSGLHDPQLTYAFERMNTYIGRDQPGFGVERVLYEFNPNWPCLSPMLRGRVVVGLAGLLPALEKLAGAGGGEDDDSRPPVDRHIIAFCAARMQPAPDRLLQGMAHPGDAVTRQRATLHLLARVQERYGPDELPALTRWLARHCEGVLESLHNEKLRARARKARDKALEAGSLVALVAAIDDPEARRRDVEGFAAARWEHRQSERRIAWLEAGGLTSSRHIEQASRSASAAVSAVYSGLLLMLLTIFYMG